jgi:hypothetical protein
MVRRPVRWALILDASELDDLQLPPPTLVRQLVKANSALIPQAGREPSIVAFTGSIATERAQT